MEQTTRPDSSPAKFSVIHLPGRNMRNVSPATRKSGAYVMSDMQLCGQVFPPKFDMQGKWNVRALFFLRMRLPEVRL